jgi:triosephosphate isomerase
VLVFLKCWYFCNTVRGYGETSAVVAAKIAAALHLKHGDGSHKLRVIACVGETLEERQAGNTMQVSFVTDFLLHQIGM